MTRASVACWARYGTLPISRISPAPVLRPLGLGGLTGPFGAVYSKQAWPQAWFDGTRVASIRFFHVLRGLARLSGADLLDTAISRPRDVQALAARRKDGKIELWIANLTGDAVTVDIGNKGRGARATYLDAERFIRAAERSDFLDKTGAVLAGPRIDLDAYAVCRVIFPPQ